MKVVYVNGPRHGRVEERATTIPVAAVIRPDDAPGWIYRWNQAPRGPCVLVGQHIDTGVEWRGYPKAQRVDH